MGSKQPGNSTERREMAAAIHAERKRLFKASAIIRMCRYATASLYQDWFDPDRLADALRAADDLIDGTAEALEPFAGDAGTRERDDKPDARMVVKSLRQDAALLLQQHPKLHTIHAQLLRAAMVIEAMEGPASD